MFPGARSTVVPAGVTLGGLFVRVSLPQMKRRRSHTAEPPAPGEAVLAPSTPPASAPALGGPAQAPTPPHFADVAGPSPITDAGGGGGSGSAAGGGRAGAEGGNDGSAVGSSADGGGQSSGGPAGSTERFGEAETRALIRIRAEMADDFTRNHRRKGIHNCYVELTERLRLEGAGQVGARPPSPRPPPPSEPGAVGVCGTVHVMLRPSLCEDGLGQPAACRESRCGVAPRVAAPDCRRIPSPPPALPCLPPTACM
jgi:hypothetical protein